MSRKKLASAATWVACLTLMFFGNALFGSAKDYVWWGLLAVAVILTLLFWGIGKHRAD